MSMPAFNSILLIARKEFSDRLRSGWVLACVVVWLGAVGLTSFYGLIQVGRVGFQGFERTVMSLLNLVQYLVPLLGLLVGHDLVVKEREEATLRWMLASGVARLDLVLGKFLGGCLTLAFPIVLGFALAGAGIGLATKTAGLGPFVLLAGSSLGLGILFVALGLAVSSCSRSRVQALVLALLTWCLAVFAFDLIALGVVMSSQAQAAAQEIERVCDATHLNTLADLHAAYDTPTPQVNAPPAPPSGPSLSWIFFNPVDLFRTLNLSKQTNAGLGPVGVFLISGFWLAGSLAVSACKLRQLDL
jgi:Cu-processing system permease protein